jgi:hypothetical protein
VNSDDGELFGLPSSPITDHPSRPWRGERDGREWREKRDMREGRNRPEMRHTRETRDTMSPCLDPLPFPGKVASIRLREKLLWHGGNLVCFVYLVDLVHLVSFVQPNKRDKPNKPNNGLFTLADFFSILLNGARVYPRPPAEEVGLRRERALVDRRRCSVEHR